MKSLGHPNVIQLYQIINTTVNTYLVIGHRSRRELLDRVQEDGHLRGGGGLTTFPAYWETMHHCHSKCGAWRPEARKYPVDDKGSIKLSDSGLDIQVSPGQKAAVVLLQPPILCPRAPVGKDYDGPAADMGSLRVLLYDHRVPPFSSTYQSQDKAEDPV